MTDPQNPAGETPEAPVPPAAPPAYEPPAYEAPAYEAPAYDAAAVPPAYPGAPEAGAVPSAYPAADAGAVPPAYPAAPVAEPYAAAPPAPYGAPAQPTVPGKTLGIVALVAVFFVSLVGLILGYVARSQSKKAGVSNTPALVAIILGWVFLVLSIILGIIFAFVLAAGLNAYSEFCQELGSGVWELTDGSTISCP